MNGLQLNQGRQLHQTGHSCISSGSMASCDACKVLACYAKHFPLPSDY